MIIYTIIIASIGGYAITSSIVSIFHDNNHHHNHNKNGATFLRKKIGISQ